MFIIGAFVGLELFFVLHILVNKIISKMMGMFMMSVWIFSKRGIRTHENAEFTWIKNSKFSIAPIVVYGKIDLTSEERRKYNLTVGAFLGLIVMLYSVIACSQFWGVRSSSGRFFMGIALMMIVLLVVYAMATIKMLNRGSEVLFDRYNEIITQLKNGATFEQIQIPMIDYYDPKIESSLKCAFLHLSFYKAFALKDFANLGKITQRLDAEMKNMGRGNYTTEPLYMGYYYPIIFYSTYINPNYANAIRFYNIAKNVLDAEKEPNGLRVMAYYQFYIMRKPDLAAITISRAEQALEEHNNPNIFPAEIEMERKLIAELRDNMTKIISPDYGYQPIISPNYD